MTSGLQPPAPYTWSVGDDLSQTLLQAQLHDMATFFQNPPVFFGYQITTQSTTNNTPVVISMDGEVFDSYNGHSTTSNNTRYVAQVPGWYYVSATVTWATATGGVRVCQIAKNGTLLTQGAYGAFGPSNFNSSAKADGFVQLNGTGDYIEMYGNQSSGAALSTAANDSQLLVWFAHV